MNRQDYSGLIDACLRLGDASRGGDPQLWTVVLEHLTKQESDVTAQVCTSSILFNPLQDSLALSNQPFLIHQKALIQAENIFIMVKQHFRSPP